ncbi:hypothetical protein [Staphylococcus epidermidis]|uniref:hypothetical protein n=1 Tax=Staphylococcus epidermidis TaxID=1282 RepID=UPI0001F4925C|nr:hypothetical protein [Staphylococcus epidermidis]EFV88780.1 putative membrane protein [Staphylococcus epidermidis FRI909]EKS26280.1 hypothetical protein HMPREF9281_02382 [Staphylococcus epidermidis BVS058A4]
MKKNTEMDRGYLISSMLNIIFLFGLIFISQLENLYVLIPYAIVMSINAIYLLVKASQKGKNDSDI